MLSRTRTGEAARAARGPGLRRARPLRQHLVVLLAGALGTGVLATGVLPVRPTDDVPPAPVVTSAEAPPAPPPGNGAGQVVHHGAGAHGTAEHTDVRTGTPEGGEAAVEAASPVQTGSSDSAAPAAGADRGPRTAGTTSPPPSPSATPAPQDSSTSAPVAPGLVVGTLSRVWAEELAPGAELTDAPDDVAATRAASHDDHAVRLSTYVVTDGPAYAVDEEALSDIEDGAGITVELGAPATAGAAHPVLARLEVAPPVLPAGALAYGEGSDDLFGLAAASVVNDVTIVLATPKGAAKDTMTVDTLRAAVNGGVHSFWSAQSRGQRGFAAGRTHGWQTLSSTCATPFALWDEVAAKVGFTKGPRKHLLVYIPPAAGCGAGMGTVGAGADSGGLTWVGYASTSIIAHELGHNMGLGHSNGLLCTGRADGTYTSGTWQSGCAAHAYRDYYDVMGVSWASLGSLAAPQADALGVLRSTEKLRTSAPVRVQLVPQTDEGLRVLRVDDPAGPYYVEYRTARAWDAWLSGNYRGLDAGVLVHRQHPGAAKEVLLLDGSLTSGTRTDDWRSALAPGASLTTASGSTLIKVEQQTADAATITVHRNGVAPPAVKAPAGGAQVELLSPTSTTGAAGTVVFAGVATAPEGTLRWEVLQGGVRKSTGSTATGVNGSFDTFQVPVALPAGTFTVRAWVADDSDGESTVDPALLVDELTVTLR